MARRISQMVTAGPSVIPDRHHDPWATHWPILIGLTCLIDPTEVVEVGSGPFSTRAFLDHTAFPNLVRLRSYEDDGSWFVRTQEAVGASDRVALHLVASPCGGAAASHGLEYADLIFVDDAKTIDGRTRSLSAVLQAAPDSAIVVVHDFEVSAYRAAVRAPWRAEMVRAMNPCTGVIWQDRRGFENRLRMLSLMVWYHASHVSPRDTQAWVAIFRTHPFWRLIWHARSEPSAR